MLVREQPAQRRRVGRQPDPTRLHEAISSLPLWPWMWTRVTPLAEHPIEAELAA